LVALLALLTALAGCAALSGPEQTAPASGQSQPIPVSPKERYGGQPPVNPTRNLYEGTLFRGPASWGNLLRDHRARYPGDLLTVTELNKIVKVKPQQAALPAAQPQQAQQAQAQGQQTTKPEKPLSPLEIFLAEQEKRRAEIEKEQNDILQSVSSMEVEVVRVLRNGNLMVRGVYPPIYRDRNRVKYVVTLSGIVRPSDVDDTNNLLAPKINQADYRIRRLVRRDTLPLGTVARAAGQPAEGALLDRFTEFLTTPGTGSRETQVSPK
jgi:flagellar basal body L-ring protein FlgH